MDFRKTTREQLGYLGAFQACCLLPQNQGKLGGGLLAKAMGYRIGSQVEGRWQQTQVFLLNGPLVG